MSGANGHCSFGPVNHDWMPSDTYPNAESIQTLFLLQVSTGLRIDIGAFYHDPEQSGRVRCDRHPRWSRDGRQICIDSIHEGSRQMYVVDVSPIISQQP